MFPPTLCDGDFSPWEELEGGLQSLAPAAASESRIAYSSPYADCFHVRSAFSGISTNTVAYSFLNHIILFLILSVEGNNATVIKQCVWAYIVLQLVVPILH